MMLSDILAVIAICLLLFPVVFNKTWHRIIEWIDELLEEEKCI